MGRRQSSPGVVSSEMAASPELHRLECQVTSTYITPTVGSRKTPLQRHKEWCWVQAWSRLHVNNAPTVGSCKTPLQRHKEWCWVQAWSRRSERQCRTRQCPKGDHGDSGAGAIGAREGEAPSNGGPGGGEAELARCNKF
jgi:hypothetical protein